MKNFVEWLKSLIKSRRMKHFAGGIFIGLLAYDFGCSFFGAVMVAACLEYKDASYDWADCSLIVVGSLLGTILRTIILSVLCLI